MEKMSFFATTAFEKTKGFLIWLINIKPIGHSSKLSGITALEVVVQKGMHEYLIHYNASPTTCQLFEATALGLYFFSCLFLVVKCGIHLYFEAKKEVIESREKLLMNGASKVKEESK